MIRKFTKNKDKHLPNYNVTRDVLSIIFHFLLNVTTWMKDFCLDLGSRTRYPSFQAYKKLVKVKVNTEYKIAENRG